MKGVTRLNEKLQKYTKCFQTFISFDDYQIDNQRQVKFLTFEFIKMVSNMMIMLYS